MAPPSRFGGCFGGVASCGQGTWRGWGSRPRCSTASVTRGRWSRSDLASSAIRTLQSRKDTPTRWRRSSFRMAWSACSQLSPTMRSGDAFTEGVETHAVEGLEVSVYSSAKTIADLFKFRNKVGVDVAVEAVLRLGPRATGDARPRPPRLRKRQPGGDGRGAPGGSRCAGGARRDRVR